MNKKLFVLFIAIAIAVILNGCSPVVQVSDLGTRIVSKVDTKLYTIELELEEPVEGYSQIKGQFSMYLGSGGGAIWQEGKGIVRGKLIASDPVPNFASIGETIIIKTTDFKIVGLLPGDTATLICTVDYEPVCSKSDEHQNDEGECQDLWEFDFCRMDDFVPMDAN